MFTFSKFRSSNWFSNLENQFCRFRFTVRAKWSKNRTELNFGSPIQHATVYFDVASCLPIRDNKQIFLPSFSHFLLPPPTILLSADNMNTTTDFSDLGLEGCQPAVSGEFDFAASTSPNPFDAQPTWSSSTSNMPLLPSADRSSRVKLWCDRVGNKFNLKPEQYSDLHVFVDVRILMM